MPETIRLQPDCEAVAVELKIGPQRGKAIISLSDTPSDIDKIVADLRAMSRPQRKGVMRSITTSIRHVVASSEIERLAPGNDDDFLADLRLLAALHEVEGDKVLGEAGIARLARIGPGRPQPDWPGLTMEGGTLH